MSVLSVGLPLRVGRERLLLHESPKAYTDVSQKSFGTEGATRPRRPQVTAAKSSSRATPGGSDHQNRHDVGAYRQGFGTAVVTLAAGQVV